MENKVPPSETLREKEFDMRMRKVMEEIKLDSELPEEGDYKKAYLVLYNNVVSAIHAIDELNFGKAGRYLRYALLDAEASVCGVEEDGDEERTRE